MIIKFLLSKVIVVGVMLIILYFALIIFNVHISIVNFAIVYGLKFITTIAIFSVIPYLVLSILDSKVIKIVLGMV